MFNIRQSSNSEEEYIAKVLAAFLKIRQQEEKTIALQIIGKQQKMEKQIKQEQHKSNENTEQPVKTIKPQKNIQNKGNKYSEYGIFENGVFICLKCQSKVKRTQDLLKHWTIQHGRQVISRKKRNINNEDTQCIKKISQETLKSESQSDL